MNSDARDKALPGIRQDALIARTYVRSRDAICGYIYKRIGSRADAEDLTQEVFARMLEYTTLLDERTILPFVYSIARNRVVDYLRCHARSRAAAEWFFVHACSAQCDTEQRVAAAEVEALESTQLSRMSPQRARIYTLCACEERSAREVAAALSLSRRTVENHLYAARQQMRRALCSCL